MKNIFKKSNWGLIVILLLATFIRFGGLTWCFPYSPHPDEWNMARAVTQMTWQDKLNPHFFAYGQFPLYLAYLSATFYNLIPWIKIKVINFQEAIFFLRFWSALAGVGTVYLVYIISSRLLTLTTHPRPACRQAWPTTHNSPSLLAALLAALTPGLIQISHFGTTESLLSFFFLLVLFFSLKIIEKGRAKYYVFLGIILGLAVGTKISALAFGFPVFLVFLIQLINTLKSNNKLKNFSNFLLKNLVLLILLVLLALLSSPYLILAFKESRGTLLYETSVATGASPVFYTRQFVNTKPIFFQLKKIFPYALGWPIFILGSFGLFLSLKSLISPKSPRLKTLIFILSFLFYFFSQAFLFTKWTRFMSPIFAFFPIFAVISLSYLRNLKYLSYLAVAFAIFPGILFSSVYFSPDIRFTASDWIYQNIPSGSKILYDTGNVVDVPIPDTNLPKIPNLPNYSLVSFDFYHLDESPELFSKLLSYLENSDYIIIPSRRIFANHLRLPEKFPLTARYYELLFSGELGFASVTKIEPFYSKIFKDEQAEETFSVFDHPTIRIYKKNIYLTKDQYEELF